MGRRRSKKSRAKNSVARSRHYQAANKSAKNKEKAEVSADSATGRSRERMRPSGPGFIRTAVGVSFCSALCLFVVGVVLVLWLHVSPFDVIDEAGKGDGRDTHNQGFAGFLSILAGIATIALALRGMSWQVDDFPADPRFHRAWLQDVLDKSVRENGAYVLTIILAGLYGAVVCVYAMLSKHEGWPGNSRVLLIFLGMMYIIVSVLPVFVRRTDSGGFRGYAVLLDDVAALAEWRYVNGSDGALDDLGVKVYEIRYYLKRIKGLMRGSPLIHVVSALPGMLAAATFFLRGFYWQGLIVLISCAFCIIFSCWLLLRAVESKAAVIADGRVSGSVFLESVMHVFMLLALWIIYYMHSPHILLSFLSWRRWWIVVVALLLVIVFMVVSAVRMLCVVFVDSRPPALGGSKIGSSLEGLLICDGVRQEVVNQIDVDLFDKRRRLNNFGVTSGLDVQKYEAILNLVIPRESLIQRNVLNESSEKRVESIYLRKYLRDSVGLNLPR
ncbi:hypothetical protein [Actinomyces sp. ZJ308]|uniref:hypothetical protein n=1 Tax=Actinomyces sp. ZJ308 TaxID=2708342 RepID=UPI001422B645|nr:hypothetical protein [Actinomyces sp. ZJ308]